VYLAPATVAGEIDRVWKEMLAENLDAFNPQGSVAWIVTRADRDRYDTDWKVELEPIVTGDDAEARIETILRTAVNLDERCRVSTLEEAKAAWVNRRR
jgi:hypothetical protein